MAKILGLDLGTNSIGWAIVENEDNNFTILDKGVRIFQEGVKIEKGIENSKAAERTDFRSARRMKFRRKLRKIEVLRVLSENGYCPSLRSEDLNNWRYKKVYPDNGYFREWLATDDFASEVERKKQTKNPYFFRNLVVSKKLDVNKEYDRYKIGRAFYHIAQRRGFLSNRLEGTKEGDGVVKKSIAEISVAKEDKTLGQYFYEKYVNGDKIRDQYTHREAHYLEEFNRICEFQNLPKPLRNKLHQAIFYQRPLKSQKGLVGRCVFEPKKPRCVVSHPKFEEYRKLCFINTIKIKTPNDEKLRFLNTTEKENIEPLFYRKSKDYFDFEEISKQLAPKKQYKFYKDPNVNPEDFLFNYTMKTTVMGCPVSARLKELFGENYMNLTIEYIRGKDGQQSTIDINDVWHVLVTYHSEEKLAEFVQKRLHLNDDQIKEFLKIHPKQEYASLSLKAINKIIPYLREDLIYSHAVFLASMEDIVPPDTWKNDENKKIIKEEIHHIIQTQNEEKQIIDAVNGIIKKSREENAYWSKEASEIFKSNLIKSLRNQFGTTKLIEFGEEKKNLILDNAYALLKKQMNRNMGRGEFAVVQRIDERVKAFLVDNFDVDERRLDKIYHPSAIDVYKPAVVGSDKNLYLGSPMVSAVRNPMAMRALHQLRKVINELIKLNKIDPYTKIHIEMARDLMNANERKALQAWQREREKQCKEYAQKIREFYIDSIINTEPSEEDILKYQLWEEQNHKCVYTGNEIAVSDFLGANPKYDIEHTIPRSQSFDNSQENKTLCDNVYNRSVKRNKIPSELDNYKEILLRIEHWKEKYEELNTQIQSAIKQTRASTDKNAKDRAIQKRHRLSYERNYWFNKHRRFTMQEVPEGFKNSQIVDTGIITKYARLYLKTVFEKVYTVKGNTVADFRKIWGLQPEYLEKERINHIHHCIDAITIACITKENYENLAKFYHEWEELHKAGVDKKPQVEKPWETFTEDIKSIEDEVLVSHYTPDVLPKQTKKKLRKRGKIQYNKEGKPIYQQGDTVRGSLHKETFYGAIEREVKTKNGEIEKQIRYVVRKPLDTLEDSNIKNIVDPKVREIITRAREEEKKLKKELDSLSKKLSNASEGEESGVLTGIDNLKTRIKNLYALPNKNGNKIFIKKVRIYTPTVTNPIQLKKQRDVSQKRRKPYKEYYHVANDANYLMAIYEGIDEKGNKKRDFELINNLQAGEYYKLSVQKYLKPQDINALEGLVPSSKTTGKLSLPLKGIIKVGSMVILWEKSPGEVWELEKTDIKKRLYKVVGLSINRIKSGKKVYEFGMIVLRFHQEARQASDLKTYDGEYNRDEPYISQRKLSHNQFNALIEGVDFILTPLGEIKQLHKNPNAL